MTGLDYLGTAMYGTVGPDGDPIIRTPLTHPYNYDAFVLWDNGHPARNTVYSDRLYQWDADKHNALCEKHFNSRGQYWNKRDPKTIEAFLCDYLGENIELCRVSEYCNPSNGYPCWRFDYTEAK